MSDMDDAAAISDILDERPELESPLRNVLAVDKRHDSWTFDDVTVDSGAFGELVSSGLVKKTDDDTYRVAHPEAIRMALDEEAKEMSGETKDGRSLQSRTFLNKMVITERLRNVDVLKIGSLLGALFVVIFARAYVYRSIFRDGAVVLSGNDPYYYRYWVEQALAASGGGLDFSALVSLPDAVQTGEPLLVATLWAFASLFGGDATAAGWVLAWYPVVAAVITAYLVYRLTMVLSEDRRVALAALLFLAVTPAHAFRTSLGFADHHAFDYVWLIITVYALVRLDARIDADWRERGQWAWAGALGLGISGQILAWDAGPLLIFPLAVYVALRVLGDMRDGQAPFVAHLPLLIGVAFGALLVYLGHAQVGWHSETVAFSPVLLTLGIIGVLSAGELAHRYGVSVRMLAGVEVVGAIVSLLALQTLRPLYWAEVMDGISRITANRNIAETQSLLSGDTVGWLLLFGFILVLAVPFLSWESIAAYRGKQGWLVPVVYSWYFLLLAIYQVRFAGQLAMFTSVFAGLGFIYLAASVDLTKKPSSFSGGSGRHLSLSSPSWGVMGQFVVLFMLVTGLSVVQVPIKTSQVVTDGDQYRTAAWMNEYAVEQGWEYPQNYVFSQWGNNRMYNYFVNGESRSYSFAQRNFDPFLSSTASESQYLSYRDKVGYIVTKDSSVKFDESSIYNLLHNHLGSRVDGVEGLSHYRAVYLSETGSRKVFTLVRGATIVGVTNPNSTVDISLQSTPNDINVEYKRIVTPNPYGTFTVTVPYTGFYRFNSESANISESEVISGSRLYTHNREGVACWPFENNDSNKIYDVTGGYTGYTNGTERVAWGDSQAIQFEGAEDSIRLPETIIVKRNSSWTIDMMVRSLTSNSWQFLIGSRSTRPSLFLHKRGYVYYRDPTGSYSRWWIGSYANRTMNLSLHSNGSELILSVNGTQFEARSPSSTELRVNAFGGIPRYSEKWSFQGRIDNLQISSQERPSENNRCNERVIESDP